MSGQLRERQVAMGLLFYPRGGSAQVARYLSRTLDDLGWPVTLACGSLGTPGDRTHAATFFDGIRVAAANYNAAMQTYRAGGDPIADPVPLHPSFEARENVPDRVFAAVSPELGDHLAFAWESLMADAWRDDPAVFHLHHLTPLHEAVERRWPQCAIVTHLHGTELKLLDDIDRLAAIAHRLDTSLEGMADRAEAGDLPKAGGLGPQERRLFEQTRWSSWRFGDHWAQRLRAAARRTSRFIVISPHDRDEAQRLMKVDDRLIERIPNGVDVERFDRQTVALDERLARWRRWLVDDPRGWDASGKPGSIRYSESDLQQFLDPETGDPAPVLLFVGRFLGFKRVPLLVRAYARARSRLRIRAPLVIWGGFPGEWEGEHPHTVAREEGTEGIFFVGWRGHRDLPSGLACADVMAAPSYNEPFGQVLLEAMACGVPVIATRSGGPPSFVNTEPGRPNGWLVEPNDVDAVADALVEAVNDAEARRQRADNAYEQIRGAFAWQSLGRRFVASYEAARQERRAVG
ncbi:MAG: glycosyltransferase family 4 protein [Solirubrobacterales bacterium]